MVVSFATFGKKVWEALGVLLKVVGNVLERIRGHNGTGLGEDILKGKGFLGPSA